MSKRLFNYESKNVVFEDDPTKAEELINSGKAVSLQLPELDNFEKTANDIYETYRKQSEAIKNNDNPLYTPEVKTYELEKLEADYRAKSAEVEKEYLAYRDKHREETRIRAAQAVVTVTDKDKLTASQFATRANLELAATHDKGAALKKITDEIALLTDGQRTALQSEILGVLTNVDDGEYASEKRSVISAVQSVKNEDILAHSVATQLPHTVLTKQNMYDVVSKVVSESNTSRGGIDVEFYEKHLKR